MTRCGLLTSRYVQGLDLKICTSPPPEDTPSLSCPSPSPYLLDVGMRNRHLLSSPPSCSKDKNFLLPKVDVASKYKHLGGSQASCAKFQSRLDKFNLKEVLRKELCCKQKTLAPHPHPKGNLVELDIHLHWSLHRHIICGHLRRSIPLFYEKSPWHRPSPKSTLQAQFECSTVVSHMFPPLWEDSSLCFEEGWRWGPEGRYQVLKYLIYGLPRWRQW